MVKCRDVLTEAFVGANKGSRQLEDVTAFNVETVHGLQYSPICRDNPRQFFSIFVGLWSTQNPCGSVQGLQHGLTSFLYVFTIESKPSTASGMFLRVPYMSSFLLNTPFRSFSLSAWTFSLKN